MAAPSSPATTYFLITPTTSLGGGVTLKFGRVRIHVEYASGQVIAQCWVTITDSAGSRREEMKAGGADIVTACVNLVALINALS